MTGQVIAVEESFRVCPVSTTLETLFATGALVGACGRTITNLSSDPDTRGSHIVWDPRRVKLTNALGFLSSTEEAEPELVSVHGVFDNNNHALTLTRWVKAEQ